METQSGNPHGHTYCKLGSLHQAFKDVVSLYVKTNVLTFLRERFTICACLLQGAHRENRFELQDIEKQQVSKFWFHPILRWFDLAQCRNSA
jgi:hypothetical protein